MNKIYEEALLFDFYGELLTERQKQVFDEVVLNDYSLSEVGAELGISRQGVHDLVKRTRLSLMEYEEKLGLVRRFLRIRDTVEQISKIAGDEKILTLAQSILDEL